MAANDSYTQQALARDPNFQLRVRANLMTVAWVVLDEADDTEFHADRAKYARTVINNPDNVVPSISTWVVMRPNLFQFETSYNFPAHAVISAAGDPDIQSQLLSDWNEIAGIPPPEPTPPPLGLSA